MKYMYSTTVGKEWESPRPPGDRWEMCGSSAVCTLGNEVRLYWFWRCAVPE